MTNEDILEFWFNELSVKDWYATNPTLDEKITHRFSGIHQQACQGELCSWRDSARGALAEIIILDQFSRNMFRDSGQAFAYDGMSLLLAQFAVSKSYHTQLPSEQSAFLLMPYMHSESTLIHQQAVELFSLPGLEYNLDFEHKHKAIIDRFGRYPHRNQLLGRESTAEELMFLAEGRGF